MKHIFVVNTHAGKAKAKQQLESMLVGFDAEHEVYYTTGPKDATRFVCQRCDSASGEALRFYACGGDGTIKEVADGVYGRENVDMTAVPLGSGNDFVKYYGGAERFLDLKALANAPSEYIDLLSVNGEMCINVCNFGFDSYAAKVMNDVRHKKLIGGSNAYTTGVIKGLLFAMKSNAQIYVDGEKIHDGNFLLCTAANGRYVGGEYLCAPRSLNNDGMVDVCAVSSISRLTLVRLINVYKAGDHLDDPEFKKIINYRRGKKIEVRADKALIVALDGELREMKEFCIEVLPSAIRFAALPIESRVKESKPSAVLN